MLVPKDRGGPFGVRALDIRTDLAGRWIYPIERFLWAEIKPEEGVSLGPFTYHLCFMPTMCQGPPGGLMRGMSTGQSHGPQDTELEMAHAVKGVPLGFCEV